MFSLYEEETDLANVWSEQHLGMSFVDGVFSAYLAIDADVGDFFVTDQLWLGMKIGTDVEMTRVLLASTPWSFEAEQCSQIGDLDADGIQPAIPVDACTGNEFLQGWNPAAGAVCGTLSVPSEYLTETEAAAAYVPLADATLALCEFGLAWDGAIPALGCMDEPDVVSRCLNSDGDDAYLGSDGDCHLAPHSCAANQYLDGDGSCKTIGGSAGQLARYTSPGNLGDSIVYDNGSSVGIGTTEPAVKLHVNGAIRADETITTTGGLHVGDISDPGDANLDVDGDANVGGDLAVMGTVTFGGRSISTIHDCSYNGVASVSGSNRSHGWVDGDCTGGLPPANHICFGGLTQAYLNCADSSWRVYMPGENSMTNGGMQGWCTSGTGDNMLIRAFYFCTPPPE